jgi:hypothetical protein
LRIALAPCSNPVMQWTCDCTEVFYELIALG